MNTDPTASPPPVRPVVEAFRFWACLGRAAVLAWHNKWTFVPIVTAAYSAGVIVNELLAAGMLGEELPSWIETRIGAYVFDYLSYGVTVFADAIVAYLVYCRLRRIPQTLATAAAHVKRIAIPVALFCILDDIAVDQLYDFYVLPLVAYGAFIWVTAQSIAVEELGPLAGLQRSLELTRGNRWRMAAIVLTIVVVLWEVDNVARLLAAAAGWYEFGETVPYVVSEIISNAIVGTYIATLLATAYNDLRTSKEEAFEQRALEAFD